MLYTIFLIIVFSENYFRGNGGDICRAMMRCRTFTHWEKPVRAEMDDTKCRISDKNISKKSSI